MLNIVIPMAGNGSRFTEAGYTTYKPFLPIAGKTMIERVIENVLPQSEAAVTLITRSEYEGVLSRCRHLPASLVARTIPSVTEGAACTVLIAKDRINTADPLLIVNSDQLVEWDVNHFLKEAEGCDASILTLPTFNPRYSFAEVINGEVIRTAEKQPLSNYGTVGIYYFRHGSDFVKAAERMIEDNERYNGEFYVAPTFNYLPRHLKIGFYNVAAEKAHFLGAPKEYEAYLTLLRERDRTYMRQVAPLQP